MRFGTEDGLNRYDAYNFTVYEHDSEDPNSLSNDYITAIHEGPSGLLWIGTRGRGLNWYQRETGQWRSYQHDGGDPDSYYRNWITAIAEDREGLLWIGTYGDGLYQFDRETEQFIYVDNIPCPCWINTLAVAMLACIVAFTAIVLVLIDQVPLHHLWEYLLRSA
jgi:ligand-binding sensor domain-containing protein